MATAEKTAATLTIVENWKGEGIHALLLGDRLVTRSTSIESLEGAKKRMEDRGVTPFASHVAPVDVDEDAPERPRRSKTDSWAE